MLRRWRRAVRALFVRILPAPSEHVITETKTVGVSGVPVTEISKQPNPAYASWCDEVRAEAWASLGTDPWWRRGRGGT